jgi:hypothetical protein
MHTYIKSPYIRIKPGMETGDQLPPPAVMNQTGRRRRLQGEREESGVSKIRQGQTRSRPDDAGWSAMLLSVVTCQHSLHPIQQSRRRDLRHIPDVLRIVTAQTWTETFRGMQPATRKLSRRPVCLTCHMQHAHTYIQSTARRDGEKSFPGERETRRRKQTA